MISGLASCAGSYTDARGIQHTIGFVDIAVAPAPENSNIAGNIIDISAVGFSVIAIDRRAGVSIGYQHVTSAALRDNAFALGPFDRIPLAAGTMTSK